MRILDTKEIADCVYRLARKAGVALTPACHAALSRAATGEDGAARFALETILQNEETALREHMPVCQDTGMAVVLIELGQDVRLTGAPLREAVDDGVARVVEATAKMGGVSIITADHGNAEHMLDADGAPFTAHTTNLVPCCIVGADVKLRDGHLADLAPTMLDLMGLNKPEEMTGETLILK